MPKVTVIMPSFNVADFIRPCIESVLSQTERDCEVLAVDAGSEDGTLEIITEYAKKDKRIQLVPSERKSYGHQINKGIAMAQGEYVSIVETDDKIESDMLEVLYQEAKQTGADYVKGTAISFLELSGSLCVQVPIGMAPDKGQEKSVVCPQEIPEIFLRDVYLWTGIYKKEFIKRIRLQESPGAAYQDAGFMFQVYSRARKAVYMNRSFYWYRQDNLKASSYDKNGFHYFVGEYNYMKQFLVGLERDWQRVYYQRMFDHCRRRFRVMASSGRFWEEAKGDMEELRGRLGQAVKKGLLPAKAMDNESKEALPLFLKSSYTVYQYYAKKYKNQLENIRQIKVAIEQREGVIFGCGAWGKFLHMLLEFEKKRLCGCIL